jgi:plasmid stabilization system protein ParE
MDHDFNPLVRRELREALDYYELVSNTKGEQFLEEFRSRLQDILENPERFPPIPDTCLIKVRLKSFPYSILYEIQSSKIRIMALRHHARHPDYEHQ